MNAGDFGVQFLFGVSFNLSSYMSLTLNFTRPDGTTFSATGGLVTISSSPVTTPVGTFSGNQYSIYTFQTGNITIAGEYTVTLTYNATGVQLISNPTNFTVGP